MLQAAFIIGIALGSLLGLIVGVAVTALISINVDESDMAAAYYYGILEGRNGNRRPEADGENGKE